jgi:signal peptidase I
MHFTRVLADLLASGQTVRFTAPGHSMHPVIRHGDVLLVEPFTHPARIGDILLYLACGRLVAHRLIAVEAEGNDAVFILKGDSAFFPDLPVRTDQVLGQVAAVERKGRRVNPHSLWTVACGLPRKVTSRVRSKLLNWSNARHYRGPMARSEDKS